MAWDTEHLSRLLDDVANTSGHASAQKSEELLHYVTSKSGEDAAKGGKADPAANEKVPEEDCTDDR